MKPINRVAAGGVRYARRRSVLLATATLVMLHAGGQAARAQSSDDTTVRLIQLLVQKGILSQQQAGELLSEARTAPARKQAVKPKPQPPTSPPAAQAAAEPEVPKGTVRVTYVPKAVRDQIAAEVKEQVLSEQQAQSGGTANASLGGDRGADWTQRLHISGDLRLRGERTFYDKGNYSQFPDFQGINALSNGYDDTGTLAPPLLNTTEDRTLYRVRARLDFAANITSWLDADVRVGTGNDTTPVSLNQTFGQPGDFSKYSLWLDRAYLRFKPTDGVVVDVGRAPNPFWTSDALFSDQLGFDGLSVQGQYKPDRDLSLFLTGGAFPVYNTAYNFGTAANTQPFTQTGGGYPSHDAYLFAAQAGADYHLGADHEFKGAAGFFDFYNVQGSLSSPCLGPNAFGSCNTDNTRAPYVQFGNTVFPIRNISANPSNPTGTADPQFYGLASRFDILDLHAGYTFHKYAPIDVVLDVDYLQNLGFNRNRIVAKTPSNNFGASSSGSSPYVGGNIGYDVSLSVGHQKLEKLWDWNLGVAYKYIESDAVLDALNNSEFHLGGTNAKGYVVNGNLGFNSAVYLSGTWLSATQVSGPPYGVNVLLVDLNAKF